MDRFRQICFRLNNERGSTLIMALVLMVVLTIIGIAVTKTSRTEVQLAGNEKYYKEAFYNADSGISFIVATAPSISGLTPGPNTEIPSGARDLDGDGAVDVRVYYTAHLGTDPDRIEVRSDSQGTRGNVSVIAGIRYPSSIGAQDDGGNVSDF
ncbi:MAG: pilus assembly PilX N-terminal domain-containing protein [Thermodesulfobacteriota bacterium]|nr:pilus assembly PilX N-terminal domain-containing protein [Thermodesulfobacteriota bacterium]